VIRRITTPNAGETPLEDFKADGLHVKRLPDDPICPRVSLGGVEGAAYLIYRGDRRAVTALLRRALAALESA
jgi:hypothetical protein